MQEEWRQTKYENYEASNLGKIRNKKTNVIIGKDTKPNKYGYRQITVYVGVNKYTVLIHSLVAETFIPNTENKPTVNHKNGNKLNNRVDNLEWATNKEQIDHAINMGLYDPKNQKKNRKVLCIELDRKFISINAAARWLNETKYDNSKIAHNMGIPIQKVCDPNKTNRTAYGFHWKYID